MSNPLFAIVGKSGSGKTTIVNILQSVGSFKSVDSYTTRPMRSENETGHTFITDEEFDQLQDIVAYVEYNGYRYCATKEQLDSASLYVIDPTGVETLFEKYVTERPIIVIYFDATVQTRIDRMLGRGDSDKAVLSRIYNDEEFDWYDKLHKAVWNYTHNENRNVSLIAVDANKDVEQVVKDIMIYVKEENYAGKET